MKYSHLDQKRAFFLLWSAMVWQLRLVKNSHAIFHLKGLFVLKTEFDVCFYKPYNSTKNKYDNKTLNATAKLGRKNNS